MFTKFSMVLHFQCIFSEVDVLCENYHRVLNLTGAVAGGRVFSKVEARMHLA
jgi:hypothetical protein